MVPIGDDIRNVDGVKHVTYTYPSLGELQAAAAEYGCNIDHSAYMERCGYYSNAGAVPYDYTIRYGNILREYRYVEVYEYKGYNNKTFRGKVDVTCVDNNSITAVGFEKVFKEKGIDFNVSENMIPAVSTESAVLYKADRMDGTVRDFYYYNYDEIKLHNKEPIIIGSRYPAGGIKSHDVRLDVTIKSSGKGSRSVAA